MFRLSRFALLAFLAGVASAAPDATLSQARTALARLPLRFEANRGQAPPGVRYLAHASGYTLSLHSGGATLHPAGSKPLTISLLHSNPASAMEGVDRLAVRTNYFLGSREHWRTDIPSYSRVRYREIYPGVDAVFYGSQNQFEYDLILRPGADPRAIRMKIGGGADLLISPEGDLVVESSAGRMIQKKPLIYQEDPIASTRHEVSGRYVLLSRHVVGLRLDHYDRRRPLVIDPSITYLTYVGGPGQDQINAVKMGPNNMLYFAGQTDSDQITPTANAYDTTNVGLVDIFLGIIDTTPGNGFPLLYLTYLGGTNNDIPLAIDVDSSGLAYLTGSTTSTDFPMAGNSFQTTGAGTAIASFVAQIDPTQGTGGLLFTSYLSGTGGDVGNGIAVDKNGLIYVIGTSNSSDFPVTATAYQTALWGPSDTFLAQIDPVAGTLNYATYLGGEAEDFGRAILVGPNGLVYFAAATLSQLFPMAGQDYNPVPNLGAATNAQDIIIGVMDMTQSGTNSLVYATYFGGSGNDDLHAMAFDQKGNLLITGYTLTACPTCPADFPITPNAMQNTYGGNGDAFVAVVNPANLSNAFLIYSTYLGGADGEVGYGIAGDQAGNIYVTGYTLSADFPMANAVQSAWGGGTNLFITKLKPGVMGKGAITFSTYLGSTGTYVPTGLTVGSDGSIYVVGWGNNNLPTTNNSIQSTFAGGVSDGFVLAIGQ